MASTSQLSSARRRSVCLASRPGDHRVVDWTRHINKTSGENSEFSEVAMAFFSNLDIRQALELEESLLDA